MNKIRCVAFDLDGTLLNDKRVVSPLDCNTLQSLGDKKIIRIAATGRNLFSIKRLLNDDFPIDYAVFSSGAGVIDWKKKEIINTLHLDISEVKTIQKVIEGKNLDYLIKENIPNSHCMHFHINEKANNDLYHYTLNYRNSSKPLKPEYNIKNSTQLIALVNKNKEIFDALKRQLPAVKLVLTTSPVNHSSYWVEFFNKEVSKAKGILSACKKYDFNDNEIMCIGNDFNDLDMLEHFTNSYVVGNAPDELKRRFKVVASNNKSGFSEAVFIHFNSLV